jgi:hypothetical protein
MRTNPLDLLWWQRGQNVIQECPGICQMGDEHDSFLPKQMPFLPVCVDPDLSRRGHKRMAQEQASKHRKVLIRQGWRSSHCSHVLRDIPAAPILCRRPTQGSRMKSLRKLSPLPEARSR